VAVPGSGRQTRTLGGELLELVRQHVHAGRELVDGGALLAEIIDPDLGIRHT
jgi:hypothetical protein